MQPVAHSLHKPAPPRGMGAGLRAASARKPCRRACCADGTGLHTLLDRPRGRRAAAARPSAHAASSAPGAASGRAAPQGHVPADGGGGGRAELGHVRGLAGGAAGRCRGPGGPPPAQRAPARRVGLGKAGRAPARRAMRSLAPPDRARMRRAVPRCWATMGSLGLCISGAEPSEPCYHSPRFGQNLLGGRSCAPCTPALPEGTGACIWLSRGRGPARRRRARRTAARCASSTSWPRPRTAGSPPRR
jgi:hypothetical protein